MSKFIPSLYQEKIFHFILKSNKNGVISAVAGSGKTTTLLQALKLIPTDKSILFLAFNKSIADELKEKVPNTDNIKVMTVHGYGYNTLLTKEEVKINNRKYNSLLKTIIDYTIKNDNRGFKNFNFDVYDKKSIDKIKFYIQSKDIKNLGEFLQEVIRLCDLTRLNLVNLKKVDVAKTEMRSICKLYNISYTENQIEIVFELLKIGNKMKNVIDYTDMIYFPIIHNIATQTFDYVFIDECQDLNTCQRELMWKGLKPKTGRFIAVGDPRQAIYGFAGADHNSYQKLINLPNVEQLPLSYTYRCGSNIVDMVKNINPDIIAHESTGLGTVLRDCSYKDIKDGDMVLCRQTFPLVKLCIKLLSFGKKAYIIGSDIGQSLSKMIKNQINEGEETTMDDVFGRLYLDLDDKINRIMSEHNITKDDAENDEYVILQKEKIMVIESIGIDEENPYVVISKIDKIFSDDRKVGIALSTVHKSKGLEANRVFIVHPELMPSSRAKSDLEILQEENLKYVAYTRAKSVLGFISDFDAWKSHVSKKDKSKEVKVSKHVGYPGMKMLLKLEITSVKEINGRFGLTKVFNLKDNDGNVFSKFGDIERRYVKGPVTTNTIGSKVEFYGIIKEHSEFNGLKITQIGKISQY